MNVTETWQLELAATEPSQVFALIEKGPLIEIEEKSRATTLGLETVTACGAETVPTWTLPNDRYGVTLGDSMMPVPESESVCWAESALSATTIVPLLSLV